MNRRVISVLTMALGGCLLLGACGAGDEVAAPEAAIADEAQSLNPAARDAAVAMITADLNIPLQDLHDLLSNAAGDGRISGQELWMQGARGTVPVDWWLWNKGYLSLVDDPVYGAHFTLSEKGSRFVNGAAPVWLTATTEGAPRMECRAAGSVTSAACTAVFAYRTVANPGADLAQVTFPASTANLEAAFTPGEGWSVSNLVVDGDAPRDTARFVIFGDPDSVSEPRERFLESIRARLEAGRSQDPDPEPASPSAPAPVAAPIKPQRVAPTAAPAASAPRPAVITNPRTLREPSYDELMAVYPARAQSADIAGRATISCVATVAGTLRDCEATSESPPGYRFGQAAVLVSRHYRLSPRTVDGAAVDSRISLTINWSMD
ncbi:MAG: TonB family protein [Brevundimonas sp.]|uniref:TonB family protein n=1 Tax=Brevundimonas sp. TaxID=1871086 RepID=UPI00272334FE|nr:TonB family protein [Brevundimonas sp.]MDO9078797.1 TonB family protein [Brevundimonas sp.]MDZ4062115.1 TonB family protein [Brevundimonas sp.]